MATVWSLSLDRVHQEAPAAEALLNLCAFLAPDVPQALAREQPQVLPERLAQAVSDALAYNRMLAIVLTPVAGDLVQPVGLLTHPQRRHTQRQTNTSPRPQQTLAS